MLWFDRLYLFLHNLLRLLFYNLFLLLYHFLYNGFLFLWSLCSSYTTSYCLMMFFDDNNLRVTHFYRILYRLFCNHFFLH